MELFKEFLLLEVKEDKLLQLFLGFAKERWRGDFEKDVKLLLNIIKKNNGSDLLDFLGNHIKGGFNREKIMMKIKTKGRTLAKEVIGLLKTPAAWNRFSGPKSFKGF